MIWLTWRQHRREAIVLAVAFAALAIYIIALGRVMYADFERVTNGLSVALCQQQPPERQGVVCGNLIGAFSGEYFGNTQPVLSAFLVLPPLIGMFVGAPLVAHEMERGTFRLVWTQSVTRLRWLLTKIGSLFGVLLLVFAAFIPLVGWWEGPFAFDLGGSGLGSQNYPIEGILPLSYMTFALALGLAAGALLRRTVPAMFATLVGYVGVALAIYNWGRPNFLPPITTTWDSYLAQAQPPAHLSPGDWVLYQGYIDKAGQHIDYIEVYQTCAPDSRIIDGPGTVYAACTHGHGWLSTTIWQPADRFWAFQGIESAILIALAVALLALTIWLVRRRGA